MFLDILSDKLGIPLNHGNLEIGLESLKAQTEKLEGFRTLLFCNLIEITFSNKDLKKSLSGLISEYQSKSVE